MEISKIRCSKDGECHTIKDQTSRDLIEGLKNKLNEVITTLNGLSGVDGGHLATDEDIAALQASIDALDNAVAGKVEKMRNSSLFPSAYVSEPNVGNTELIPVDVGSSSYSIARRGIDGGLQVAEPKYDHEATNKFYVDNKLADMQEYVDQQIANNGGSSGGSSEITHPFNVALNGSFSLLDNAIKNFFTLPYSKYVNAGTKMLSTEQLNVLSEMKCGCNYYAEIKSGNYVYHYPVVKQTITGSVEKDHSGCDIFIICDNNLLHINHQNSASMATFRVYTNNTNTTVLNVDIEILSFKG